MHRMSISIADAIHRLKQSCSIKTDLECAQFLGVHPSTLSNWKTRNTIQYSILVKKCSEKGLNLHYVLTGEGDPIFPSLLPTPQQMPIDTKGSISPDSYYSEVG